MNDSLGFILCIAMVLFVFMMVSDRASGLSVNTLGVQHEQEG